MQTYTTAEGDAWDMIAYKVYGKEKYTGLLLYANPAYVGTFIFDAGTVLNVPELTDEEAAAAEIPAWRRR